MFCRTRTSLALAESVREAITDLDANDSWRGPRDEVLDLFDIPVILPLKHLENASSRYWSKNCWFHP